MMTINVWAFPPAFSSTYTELTRHLHHQVTDHTRGSVGEAFHIPCTYYWLVTNPVKAAIMDLEHG